MSAKILAAFLSEDAHLPGILIRLLLGLHFLSTNLRLVSQNLNFLPQPYLCYSNNIMLILDTHSYH